MGNLILKKFIAALISSAIITILAIVLLPMMVTDLQQSGGAAVTADNLLSVSGLQTFFVVLFALSLITVLIVTLLLPSHRRRNRSSGTIVEADTDDGRERGTVKWFNMKKGFGFITWERGNDREDVFVHFRSIRGQGYRTLTEGQKVKFTIVTGDKGPQAEDVSAVR